MISLQTICFNSLFVGMCFAIESLFILPIGYFCFNSLFVGMCFAIGQFQGFKDNGGSSSFNSLFVGMCFAIDLIVGVSSGTPIHVSIPFSSGCALQSPELVSFVCHWKKVSIPFSSGCALQYKLENWIHQKYSRFNSLFVGMCFAIDLIVGVSSGTPIHVSIPFSSGCALQSPELVSFVCHWKKVSIPFSSGCALQLGGAHKHSAKGTTQFQFPFRRDVLCNRSVSLLTR